MECGLHHQNVSDVSRRFWHPKDSQPIFAAQGALTSSLPADSYTTRSSRYRPFTRRALHLPDNAMLAVGVAGTWFC
jgi:hypothetical protein